MCQPVQQYPGACAWQARGRRSGFPRTIRHGKRRGRRNNFSPASRVLPIELYTGLAVGDRWLAFWFGELVFSLYRTTSPDTGGHPPVVNTVVRLRSRISKFGHCFRIGVRPACRPHLAEAFRAPSPAAGQPWWPTMRSRVGVRPSATRWLWFRRAPSAMVIGSPCVSSTEHATVPPLSVLSLPHACRNGPWFARWHDQRVVAPSKCPH